MEKDLEKIWFLALGELEVVISKANFQTWFRKTFIYDYKKDVFTIGVPTIFIEDYLKKHYLKEIKNALQKQIGEPIIEIKFKVSSPAKNFVGPVDKLEVIHRPVDNFGSYPQVEKPVDNSIKRAKNESLNERYIFDNFIVGPSNQLAHAAAKSIVEKPSKTYNPLYIYGDSGLGKTHLLQAVGFGFMERQKKTKVLYVSCETFTNDYIESVRAGKAKEFKDRYRNIDILIVDDIQFLGKMDKTQEEFFHTFNHLHQKNKQVVLASDRPPKAIKGLEKRLQTRFEWGMVVDIQAPDFETRCAILRSKCQERRFPLDEDVITFIARNITSDIRQLEGALTKLSAYCELTKEKTSLAVVEKILAEVVARNQTRRIVSVDKILKAVHKFYQVPVDDLVNKKRNKQITKPRQVAMYLVKTITGLSFPNIGDEFGGRDHTTILYGYKIIKRKVVNSKSMRDEIELLKEMIFE